MGVVSSDSPPFWLFFNGSLARNTRPQSEPLDIRIDQLRRRGKSMIFFLLAPSVVPPAAEYLLVFLLLRAQRPIVARGKCMDAALILVARGQYGSFSIRRCMFVTVTVMIIFNRLNRSSRSSTNRKSESEDGKNTHHHASKVGVG